MAQLSSPHKAVSAVSTQIDTPELGSSPKIKMEPIPESCVDSPPPDYQPTCTSNAASTFSKISSPPLAQLSPVPAPSFTAIYTPTSSNTYTCINSPTPIYPLISTLASSTTTPRRTGRQGRATKERTLVRNKPIETVNYPCHEGLSQFHRQKLLELSVYPIDGISNYSRSIPFKGAKESFLKSTGRSRFDVFEYRFTAPNIKGEEKNWWVMWDYYNGLVRVHDFFDCCKPGKTEPGNAVKEKINPGLQSICHNITGGNLHAQGYWIPYPAAKALATKFCFRIRYALTIIFGEDFPSLCLPESHPNFGKYSIDLEIIESCKETSAQQFVFEKQRASTSLYRPGSATLSESRPKVLTPVSNMPASDSCRSSSAVQAQKSGQTVGYHDHVHSIPASDNNGGSSDIQVYKSGQTGRYYDTARGIWTLGGADRNCSPLENTSRPVNSSALAKISTGTIFKSGRAPKPTYSGAFGGNVTARKTPTVPLVGQRTYMQMPGLPATGHYYFNESCVRGTQPFKTNRAVQETQEGLGVPTLGHPRVDNGPTTNRSTPQPLVREVGGKGATKRCNPKNAFISLQRDDAPLLSPIELGTEDSRQSPNKKTKLTEPHRFNNPYMNRVKLEVGTFQNPGPRSCRDESLPRIQNPFTRECYDRLVFSQIEEKPEEVQAASSLMALKCRYHDRDWVESSSQHTYGMPGNSYLKRRRST